MKANTLFLIAATALVCLSGCREQAQTAAKLGSADKTATAALHAGPPTVPVVERAEDLAEPVALEADGKRIDIGTLSRHGHAGPCVADIDGDGDEDLLVGDFPGYFWFFENVSEGSTPTDSTPIYASAVKFQAGGKDAKVPVY